ncbi:copper amine oxidase N-terminal domain-containing protein [Paenibacillus sp. An7]|uniref:copper amine oxidase N-terminal domain-containing protein n=1 Tax=Paenibacillus sp. An7 TaxID=2689577 RepID=UPI00135794F4|nr:copper amine oxidase N-terminal domain-containing protein [Paenibacillus sp. An7]
MLKKQWGLITLALVMVWSIMGSTVSAAASQNPIRVYLDQVEMKFDVPPTIKNGVTFVQFRPLFEGLDYTVKWNNADKRINADNGETKLQLIVGKKSAHINGQRTKLPAAPYISKGSMLVPLRFVAEATGYNVIWDQKKKTIQIETGKVDDKTKAQVNAFLSKLSQAENERSIEKVSALVDNYAPFYEEMIHDYREYFKSQGQVTYTKINPVNMYDYGATVFVTKTNTWKSGPFYFDVKQDLILKLTKASNGNLQVFYEGVISESYAAEELIGKKPVVPVKVKSAIEETLNTQYEGYNTENKQLLLSSFDPTTWIYRDVISVLEDGWFEEFDYSLSATEMNIVQYDGETAIVHTEETDLEGDHTSMYYMKQNLAGKWLIADTFVILRDEDGKIRSSLSDSREAKLIH